MPTRVQLQRRSGWRLPSNTIKVDRSTRWGNPFRVARGYPAIQALSDYRVWLAGKRDGPPEASGVVAPCLADIRQALRGKNLACWCSVGEPCHAEVLLDLANTD